MKYLLRFFFWSEQVKKNEIFIYYIGDNAREVQYEAFNLRCPFDIQLEILSWQLSRAVKSEVQGTDTDWRYRFEKISYFFL